MTTLRFRSILALALAAGLSGCGAAPSDVAVLQEKVDSLEKRVGVLEQAAATSAVDRSDAVLAATLSVVQAVGRGQDPTTLPTGIQVAYCRSTGWTVRDLAALGGSMRAAVIARDAGINACREAGQENPTEADVRETEHGKRWVEISTVINQIHGLMEAGRWDEAKQPLAPRPPAADGG